MNTNIIIKTPYSAGSKFWCFAEPKVIFEKLLLFVRGLGTLDGTIVSEDNTFGFYEKPNALLMGGLIADAGLQLGWLSNPDYTFHVDFVEQEVKVLKGRKTIIAESFYDLMFNGGAEVFIQQNRKDILIEKLK